MHSLPQRVIAVDWSGARGTAAKKKIWLAEADAKGLRTLKDGLTREAARDLICAARDEDPALVVGLDFSFSFPDWFVRAEGCTTAPEFWRHTRRVGNQWLRERQPPFFSKGGWADAPHKAFRATDRELRAGGHRPETVFKLVGPTQVGPGSIRGMPILDDLRQAGFHIWPFDPPQMPLVLEIYPRLFYGAEVTKTNLEQRVDFLKRYPDLDEGLRLRASCSDDAFDAAVSALAMAERREQLLGLPTEIDETTQLEGRIWF
ncbi:MAG: hypothetical protein AAF657_13795 [Acidobacteriota bacterium]